MKSVSWLIIFLVVLSAGTIAIVLYDYHSQIRGLENRLIENRSKLGSVQSDISLINEQMNNIRESIVAAINNNNVPAIDPFDGVIQEQLNELRLLIDQLQSDSSNQQADSITSEDESVEIHEQEDSNIRQVRLLKRQKNLVEQQQEQKGLEFYFQDLETKFNSEDIGISDISNPLVTAIEKFNTNKITVNNTDSTLPPIKIECRASTCKIVSEVINPNDIVNYQLQNLEIMSLIARNAEGVEIRTRRIPMSDGAFREEIYILKQ